MHKIVNPKQTRLFDPFDIKKDSESRRLLRQQVAEDMYLLIRRFADTAEHTGRDTM